MAFLFLLSRWQFRRRSPGSCSAEPVRFFARFDDVGTVRQPIDECPTEPRVRDDLCPPGERQIGGHYCRGLFRTISDHLEQQFAGGLGKRYVTQLVDTDEINPLPSAKCAA